MSWQGAARLKQLLQGKNTADVARRVGVDYTTVLHWQAGRRGPRSAHLRKLCEVLGVSADEFFNLEPRMVEAPPRQGDSVGFAERLGRVAAGSPRFDVYEKGGKRRTYYFREEFLKHLGYDARDPERWLPVRVSEGVDGESMIPTIQPGALLLVDRGSKPEPRGVRTLREVRNKAIYLCFVKDEYGDGGITVKRVVKAAGILVLMPDNAACEPIPVPLTEDLDLGRTLIGRVVWVGQELA